MPQVTSGPLEQMLLDALRRGQNVLLYGPVDHSAPELRRHLQLR